jgi:hypothetical protein
MTRPIYETQTDRNNERRLAAKIEKHYNCMLTKMPMKLSLDFMAMRDGKAVAFIEARQRKIAMNTYPTYMLSLYKAMQARC